MSKEGPVQGNPRHSKERWDPKEIEAVLRTGKPWEKAGEAQIEADAILFSQSPQMFEMMRTINKLSDLESSNPKLVLAEIRRLSEEAIRDAQGTL